MNKEITGGLEISQIFYIIDERLFKLLQTYLEGD